MGKLSVPVTQHDHTLGPANAPVTLVEYGDYECPACGAAYPIVNLILQHFGPKLRYVFRHFPLTQVHPDAESAAESAEFAGAHKRFWEMHTVSMKIRTVWVHRFCLPSPQIWDYLKPNCVTP
jgi:protein-disulfide isomerase